VSFSSLSLNFSKLALCFEDPNHAACAWKFSVSTNFIFRFKDTDEEMEHMFPGCLYQMSQEYDSGKVDCVGLCCLNDCNGEIAEDGNWESHKPAKWVETLDHYIVGQRMWTMHLLRHYKWTPIFLFSIAWNRWWWNCIPKPLCEEMVWINILMTGCPGL
jgi:hypothetical protein